MPSRSPSVPCSVAFWSILWANYTLAIQAAFHGAVFHPRFCGRRRGASCALWDARRCPTAAGWGWLRPHTALARPAAPRLHHHGASAAAGLPVLEGRIWPAARQVSHQALVSERSRPTRALPLALAPAEVELGRSLSKFLNNLGNACYWIEVCC